MSLSHYRHSINNMKFLIVLTALVAAASAVTTVKGSNAVLSGPSATLIADTGAIVKSDLESVVLPSAHYLSRGFPIIKDEFPLIRDYPIIKDDLLLRGYPFVKEDLYRSEGKYYDPIGRPLYF